jgi:hypothetical protein
LVVIDDTDRFARLDVGGKPQVDPIHRLLTNAVHVLCEAEPPIDGSRHRRRTPRRCEAANLAVVGGIPSGHRARAVR